MLYGVPTPRGGIPPDLPLAANLEVRSLELDSLLFYIYAAMHSWHVTISEV